MSGGTARLYIDGTLAHTGSNAGTTTAQMPWHLMRNGVYSSQSTRGLADEVATYDQALSSSTVAEHYQRGKDATPPAPTSLSANPGDGKVDLNWSDNSDFEHYARGRAERSARGPVECLPGGQIPREELTGPEAGGRFRWSIACASGFEDLPDAFGMLSSSESYRCDSALLPP